MQYSRQIEMKFHCDTNSYVSSMCLRKIYRDREREKSNEYLFNREDKQVLFRL